MGQDGASRIELDEARLRQAGAGARRLRRLLPGVASDLGVLLGSWRQREIAECAAQPRELVDLVEGAPVELDAKMQLREGAVPSGVDFGFFAAGRFDDLQASLSHRPGRDSCMLAFDVRSRESGVRVRSMRHHLVAGEAAAEPTWPRGLFTGDAVRGSHTSRLAGPPDLHHCVAWRDELLVATRSGYYRCDPVSLEPVVEGTRLPREIEPAAGRSFNLHPRTESESGRLLSYTREAGAAFSTRHSFLELDEGGAHWIRSYEWPGRLASHAFGFTRRHYLLPQMPVQRGMMRFERGSGRRSRGGGRDDGRPGLRVHIVPRDPARSPLSVVFQLHGFIQRIVNAWEESGILVFDAFVSSLDSEGEYSALAATRRVWSELGGVFRFSVDLLSGKATKRPLAPDIQRASFACIDEARRGRSYRAAWYVVNDQGCSHLLRLDTESGAIQRWRWDERVFLRQPCLVGRGGEDGGWLVVPLFRPRETQLAIFDSSRIDRGPVAVLGADARLPIHGHASAISRTRG